MEHQPKKPTVKGPAEWFTGDVYIDPIAQGRPPSRLIHRCCALHARRPDRLALP